jgi:HAD superfamily hydrolase (TIGR01509 family)
MDHALVILDCDGVLVDSEVLSNEVLARELSAAGLPTTTSESRRAYQGMLLADIAAAAEEQLGRPLPPGWQDRYERERDAAFARGLRAVPGVEAALGRLRDAGLGLCVASQGKLEKMRLTLGLTGLLPLLDEHALFSTYSVPRGKPHPDLFLHAAAVMGAAPSACVVVEDTPSGVLAAVAAGMRTLGYAADSDEGALRAAGAEVFHSMDTLPQLVGVG